MAVVEEQVWEAGNEISICVCEDRRANCTELCWMVMMGNRDGSGRGLEKGQISRLEVG